MMDLLHDELAFSGKKGFKWQSKLFLINFNKSLSGSGDYAMDVCEHSICDLLHAVAGVCSVSLPDMEVSAIYATLTAPACTTAVILTTKQNVVAYRTKIGPPARLRSEPPATPHTCCNEEDNLNPFACIISDNEEEEEEEEDEDENKQDKFVKGRQGFLDKAMERKSLSNQLDEGSVGAEHCILGCAAFSPLLGSPNVKAVQLSLLAVRKSCRKMGIGRHLVQCCKDPEIVGHYNVLLTFADPTAEDFFNRHNFSEDPILTARYQSIVEPWENSTLMAYIPPFSEAGLAVGSLKTLAQFQDYYKQWRDGAITGYSTQLGMMERLRHELLLLHSKVQSQEELIIALSKELKQAKEDKALLEQEFQQYRKRSQLLLCDAAAEEAQEWIRSQRQ